MCISLVLALGSSNSIQFWLMQTGRVRKNKMCITNPKFLLTQKPHLISILLAKQTPVVSIKIKLKQCRLLLSSPTSPKECKADNRLTLRIFANCLPPSGSSSSFLCFLRLCSSLSLTTATHTMSKYLVLLVLRLGSI